MCVNLCNTAFGVNVSSSTVSTEGHDVSNLLHADRQHNRNGFMAERFIKPPVDIIFSFPFMIEIKEIFLDPSVGNQVSCGFEIFTASSSINQRQEECDFQSVGKSPWSNSTFHSYRFVNRRYRQRLHTGHCGTNNDRASTSACDQGSSFALRHRFSQFLVQVTHVKVKITRTHGGSIPCLRRIEINGQPSYFCSKTDVESFTQKVQLLREEKELGNSSRDMEVFSKGPEPKKPDRTSELPISRDDKQIPEEFKDSLTCDLMSLPIILPSGHTIDQITLDKHTAAEAEWGRPPSDPFTGVAFSDSSKPVPNLLLKSRLDDFILKAGRRYQHLARKTVGVPSHSHITSSKSPESISKVCKDNKPHQNQTGTHLRTKTGAPVSILNSPTSKLKGVISKDKCHSSGATVKRKIEKLDFTSDFSKAKRSLIHGGDQRHEDVVRDSLLSALDATLTQLPSFQEESSSTGVSTGYSQLMPTPPDLVCSLCGRTPADSEDGGSQDLYQFPCNHICCRPCLLKSLSGSDQGRYTCSTCNVEVDSKSICKVHAMT